MNSKLCVNFMKLWRTKSADSVTSETSLHRCLGLFDLIVIGIGGMVGSGIYVMTGFAIRDQAGPSTVISFVLAALVVVLVAACYTELASKLHKTGSTYLYLYLTIGEFPAFLTGFSLLIMCCLGIAVNARAWSSYFDSLFSGAISNFTVTHIAEWSFGPPFARYPDFLAVFIIILPAIVVSLGVNFMTKFSSVFVVVNIFVLMLVTVCGFVFGNMENWTRNGYSSFFPYGWSGTIQVAAVCFWAFSGFETISSAVEETQFPQRNIPIATGVSMLIVTLLYVSTTSALSLMVPYSSMSITTPLASVFDEIGQQWGRYVVSVGTLCALTTAILSSFYGFMRFGYAMSEDGLLFSCFRKVNSRTKVPVLSAVICGVADCIIAFCLDVKDLIAFSVNLILLSYCTVCASVIILSYWTQTEDARGQVADNGYLPLTTVESDDDEINAESVQALYLCVDDTTVAETNGIGEADELCREGCSTDPVIIAPDGAANKGNGCTAEANVCTTAKDQKSCTFQHKLFDVTSKHEENKCGAASNGSENFSGTADDNPILDDTPLLDENMPLYISPADNTSSAETIGYLHSSFVCLAPCMICKNGKCAVFAFVMMLLFMLGLSFCLKYAMHPLERRAWWSIVLLVTAILGVVVFMGILCVHRQTYQQVLLKLNCIPLVPSAGLALCLMLLVANATASSWIGCGVILAFALVVYLSYSVHHSRLNLCRMSTSSSSSN